MSSSDRAPRLPRVFRERRGLLVAIVVLVIAVVAGASLTSANDHAVRDSVAPVEWRGALDGSAPGSEMRIRLQRDGTAEVIDAPRGDVTRQDRDEARQNRNGRRHLCFAPAGTGVYTGPATWEVVGEWGIRVQFDDSSLILRAGKGGSVLRDPDWNSPRMPECGENGKSWRFTRLD
ncbi:hypothetical protein [Microbacterium sp. SL75]|uniref:hypothetical protein n=1 Tax=Microbacterium sp. SL75 TaxID=2995140 RepID=UPI0022712A78|nr:hypothetical protein [Microbacterium sp. SL75]WAC70143.1 hypothetical protein OVA17_05475 [Microbacterium sp. SL75]